MSQHGRRTQCPPVVSAASVILSFFGTLSESRAAATCAAERKYRSRRVLKRDTTARKNIEAGRMIIFGVEEWGDHDRYRHSRQFFAHGGRVNI